MISDLTFEKQSLLMAKLSQLAYQDNHDFSEFGYDSIFLDNKGSQAYFLWDKDDFIIVSRGTQPTELTDIISDIQFALVPSSAGVGHVHHGFKLSVEHIWIDLLKLIQKYGKSRKAWSTGHSLGAAMATLITTRCARTDKLPKPVLFTFGSPRVGNLEYIKLMNSLEIDHHRWVNNEDIVTRNPIYPYSHHGTVHYFDHHGNVAVLSKWQTFKDRVRGFITGIKKGKVNFFVNHDICNYIKNLERL